MANQKISDLTEATDCTGAELVAVVQGGTTKKAPLNTRIKAYFDTLYIRPYACVTDTKTAGTDSGSITSGSYVTRVINQKPVDGIGITLSSNQLQMPAGTYECDIILYGYFCDRHKGRLRNVTDSTTVLVGTSAFSGTGGAFAPTVTAIKGRFTLATAKTLEVQHRIQTTNVTNAGGVAANLGENEVYLIGQFWKVA